MSKVGEQADHPNRLQSISTLQINNIVEDYLPKDYGGNKKEVKAKNFGDG